MSEIAELAQALARQALAVCRHYLSEGHKQGRYWRVGDVHNQPGQSLYVHLSGDKAGRWADAATGQFGDLIDLIEHNQGLSSKSEAIGAARDFIFLMPRRLPRKQKTSPKRKPLISQGDRARMIYSASRHIGGSIAEAYLKRRGIELDMSEITLRFHPSLPYYEPGIPKSRLRAFPALIAGIADEEGQLLAIQRTWLDPVTSNKASIPQPRRSLGPILGNGIRIGKLNDVLIAGEGLETVLSVRMLLPQIPMIAALSAAHLGQILFPYGLKRLYGLIDQDAAGEAAAKTLAKRTHAAGIDFSALRPQYDDFNTDLIRLGADRLRAMIIAQLAPCDRP